MPTRAKKHTFVAKLARFTSLYCIEVPADVSRLAGKASTPVIVRIVGAAPFHATLVPAGGGRHRLFLNAEVRASAGLRLGGRVQVELTVDAALRTREVPIPPDLREALHDEGVLGAWESMPPGKREHILRWIEQAVHEPTREKRVSRAVMEALATHEKRIDRASARPERKTRAQPQADQAPRVSRQR
jgi:hypothetical protein